MRSLEKLVYRPAPIELLAAAVGLVLVFRYRWILDDSFIYYRYVDNLLFLHRGLVFNTDEFVEGYSSPLWLMVLIGFRSLRLDYWTITTAVAIVSYCAFALACGVTNQALKGQGSGPTINIPLICVSTAYGPVCYFSSGSEGPLMQLAAAAVALYALKPSSKIFQVLVAGLPLVRNEFVIPVLLIVLYSWLVWRQLPRVLIATSALLGFGYLAFRVYYFAEFFPAPFYLKDKVSVRQGLHYLGNCIEPYAVWWFLAAAAVMLMLNRILGQGHLRMKSRVLMWLAAGSAIPYVVKVGGDMMHYRLLAFSFCLMILSLGGLVERWLSSVIQSRSAMVRFVLGVAVGAVAVVHYPRFLSSHPFWGKEEREADQGISDASYHRHSPPLEFTSSRTQEDRSRLDRYDHQDASLSDFKVECWCQSMFEDIGNRYVHFCGLTEPILARVDVPEQRPGHKAGLLPLAYDLARIRSHYHYVKRGITDIAIRDGLAPKWLSANRNKTRMVEARMYNSHDFIENLEQSLRRVGTIRLGSSSGEPH